MLTFASYTESLIIKTEEKICGKIRVTSIRKHKSNQIHSYEE